MQDDVPSPVYPTLQVPHTEAVESELLHVRSAAQCGMGVHAIAVVHSALWYTLVVLTCSPDQYWQISLPLDETTSLYWQHPEGKVTTLLHKAKQPLSPLLWYPNCVTRWIGDS